MTNITLLLAVLFCTYVIVKRNTGAAVGIIVFSMIIWPEYLRIFIGPVAFSIPRFAALILLIRLLLKNRHLKIKRNSIDSLVVVIWLWIIFATVIEGSALSHTSQMIGKGLDTVLMYYIARMSFHDENDLKAFYGWLVITAISMCIIGVIETTTSYSVYDGFTQYREWHWIDKANSYRLGMLRAKASTSVHIYFGMFMMMIAGMLWSIRKYIDNNIKYKIALLSAFLAALTSLSSGPWLACAFIIIFALLEKRTKYINKILVLLAIFTLFLEMSSNRHFYNLIDYLALNSGTAWYRTRLLEIAVNNLNEYWLFGAGSNMPHHWGQQLDGRLHIDIVNHFLMIGLYGGLPAMFMYIAMHVKTFKYAILARKKYADEKQRSLLYGLLATILALDISSMSVSLFGPPLILSYILVGVTVAFSENNFNINSVKENKNDR